MTTFLRSLIAFVLNVTQTIPHCDEAWIRVGAGLAFSTASTLSKANMLMAVRVSIVALFKPLLPAEGIADGGLQLAREFSHFVATFSALLISSA
jgi:hypothetical protein